MFLLKDFTYITSSTFKEKDIVNVKEGKKEERKGQQKKDLGTGLFLLIILYFVAEV